MTNLFLTNTIREATPFEVTIPLNMIVDGRTVRPRAGISLNNNPNYGTNLSDIIQTWIDTNRITIPPTAGSSTVSAATANALLGMDVTLTGSDYAVGLDILGQGLKTTLTGNERVAIYDPADGTNKAATVTDILAVTNFVIYGEFDDDADAALGGTPVLGIYRLTAGNSFGLPQGMLKQRTA